MSQIQSLAVPDVKILVPQRHGDHRGFFSETYSRRTLLGAGIDIDFVQDNHAFSAQKGTLRGLHFQTPPYAQHKLVRVVRGSIFDVAVDLRVGSPSYGQSVSAILSAAEGNQILVPVGFAHGLLTLEPDTEVLYKVSAYYAPEHDKGLLWDDPALDIRWPLEGTAPLLSAKDQAQPRLAELPVCFHYAGNAPEAS